MIASSFVLLAATFLLLHYLFKTNSRRFHNGKGKRLPGPPSLPFVGCIPFILPIVFKYKTNYDRMRKTGEKYGGVFAAQLGVQYCCMMVHIDDYNIAREVMCSEEWRNRFNDHPSFYERSFNQQIGLALANGDHWKEMRKFTTQSLRQFGFGKKITMESSLACELENVMSILSKKVDEQGGSGIVSMHLFFNVAILNLLWTMMVGQRFAHDDLKLRKLLQFVDKVSKSAPQGLTPVFAFPFLRYIPHATEHDMILKLHYEVQSLFRSIIEEKRRKGTYLEDPEDFIDAFLQQIHYKNQSKDHDSNQYQRKAEENLYTDEQLIMVCTDLFFTGSDTSSTALEFAFLYMILNPEVQEKVQEEIDRVVGKERLPSLEDKSQMPYTEATTLEILRWSSILPITSRCSVEDTMVSGYFVPKGTIAGINLYSIHFSNKVWEDPLAFRPERFLGENNQIINSHKIMPFGHGKRTCMGEVTARSAIFTFLTSILQKYTFQQSPNHPAPSTEPLSGFTQYTQPYHALVTLR